MVSDQRIRACFGRVDAGCIVVVPGANMVYLTGLHVHLSERLTLAFVMPDAVHWLVPSLELGKVQALQAADTSGMTLSVRGWDDVSGYEAALQASIDELGLQQQTVAVDGQTMRVFEWLALQRFGIARENLRDAGDALKRVRMVKTSAEVDAMRRAIAISEAALEATLAQVRVGMSERDLARLLETGMFERGAQGLAFDSIVLTGARTALPHGSPGDTTIERGDLLLFDFGAMVDGYPADITRVFAVGEASVQQRDIHETVRRASEAGNAMAAPDVTPHQIDRAARQVIEDAGYGEYFTHRTGHGLGLETHELPQVATGNHEPLPIGAVFTVEPGVYLPDVGGVRIEDNLVITGDGAEILTHFPRELRVLPV